MNWLDVRGHLRPMRLLQMAYAGGRMPHAWLFHGPGGVGKEMLAVRFARLLLCDGPVPMEPPAEAHVPGSWFDGCGQCRSCHLVEVETHPDLRLIYRELNKFHPDATVQGRKALDISVDVVRHFLLDPVRSKATLGGAKVFLVRDADLLSTAAQNALLKTLEEPPADTYLILLSGAAQRLLPTTNSRCQGVGFGPLDAPTTRQILAAAGVPPAEAAFYAALSEGRPGHGVQLARMNVRANYGRIAEGLAGVGSADPVQLASDWQDIAQGWAKTLRGEAPADDETPTDLLRTALRAFFVAQGSLFRGALRLGAAAPGQPIPPEAAAPVRELVKWGGQPLAEAIRQVNAADAAIARNANTALTLEGLAVKLAEISRGAFAGSADQA